MMWPFFATDEETSLVSDILAFVGCESSGILDSEAGVGVFMRSGLSHTQLRDIWAIADEQSKGSLSKKEIAMAIRLMGWAQAGEKPSVTLLQKGVFVYGSTLPFCL